MSALLLAGVACFVGALALSAALTPLVRRWARARGFVDRPGERKAHAQPIALGGGVAIFLAVFLPLAVGSLVLLSWGSDTPAWLPGELAVHVRGATAKLPQLGVVLLGLAAVFALGLLDDRRGLSSGLRLTVELAIGVMLWTAGVQITGFVAIPGVSLVLTALWVAAITNSFNLLDNMDGLSSGVAVIAAVVLAAALAAPDPQLFVIALLLLTAGAAMGFWLFNRPPATIFMGDAGSKVLGYLLAVTTTLATFYGEGGRTRTHALAVPLLVLAIPLYDTASVVILRLRRGVSPFVGDRNHFSHRLMRLGLSPWGALATIYLATLLTGLSALLVDQVSAISALLLIAQGGMILCIIAILEAAGLRSKGQGSRSGADDSK